MAGLISKVIGGLYNGVSQQAPDIRLESQGEGQVNCVSSLVRGLGKRPPTQFVTELDSLEANSNSFVHKIIRDNEEKYILVISNSGASVKVFKLDGTECTVNAEASANLYLSSLTDVKNELSALTVADYTFLVNKNKEVAMDSTITSGPDDYDYSCIIHIAKGLQSTDYNVFIDGQNRASYSSPDADTPSGFKSDYIAQQLQVQLVTNVSDLYSVEVKGSTIKLTKNIGENAYTEFACYTEDSWGNQAMYCSKKGIQSFTNIPTYCWEDTVLEIQGADKNDLSNYYVKYDSDNGKKTGVWIETIKPHIETTLDNTTMPIALVRESDGTFTLKYMDYEERKVGDENSASVPSFVGQTIEDIFMYRNRLGLLSDENVILSKTSEFFDYFPTTVMDILDSDPIDIAVSTDEVNKLKHAVAFNETLLLFSDRAQFILSSGDNLLTPSTGAIDTTTRFETSTYCKPVGIGPNVYFPCPKGNHSAVREYFVQPNTLVNDASDVSAHVPDYLPGTIIKLTASTNMDMLFALGTDEPNAVYVYQFNWAGDEKAQSAWHKWEFDYSIIDINVMDNHLYLLVESSGKIFLEKIDLELTPKNGHSFIYHLDHRVQMTAIYDDINDYTNWTLPYSVAGYNHLKFKAVHPVTGNELNNIFYGGDNTFQIEGDYSDQDYVIGMTYDSTYNFTPWSIKRKENNTNILHGALQTRTMTVSFQNTGYFKVHITPKSRDTLEYIYTGVTVNEQQIGEPSIVTDKKRFLVMAKAYDTEIKLINDDYLPFYIQAVAWEGMMVNRAGLM